MMIDPKIQITSIGNQINCPTGYLKLPRFSGARKSSTENAEVRRISKCVLPFHAKHILGHDGYHSANHIGAQNGPETAQEFPR